MENWAERLKRRESGQFDFGRSILIDLDCSRALIG